MRSWEFMSLRLSISSIRSESIPNLNRSNSLKINSIVLDQWILNNVYEEQPPRFSNSNQNGYQFSIKYNCLRIKV